MDLITPELRIRLLANGHTARHNPHFDPWPVVKWFNPCGEATWLIADARRGPTPAHVQPDDVPVAARRLLDFIERIEKRPEAFDIRIIALGGVLPAVHEHDDAHGLVLLDGAPDRTCAAS
ncbi:MAG: hypothetical protein NVSMB34_08490 [Variovorax sp.]